MKTAEEIVPLDPEDSAFLGHIYEKYGKTVQSFALKYADNPTQAEDATHDAFIKVIKYLPRLKKMSSNRRVSYLRVTVKTTVVDYHRKKNPEVPLSDALCAILEDREQDILSDLSMDWRLQQLRNELSPRDWLALEGKYFLGYSDEELAKMLGVKTDSIRMILSRAYGKSRGILRVRVE